MLQARVNFKGVESRSLFFKLLFTGHSFFQKCFSSGCDVNPVSGCSRALQTAGALSVPGPAGFFQPAVRCCALAFLMMLFCMVLFWLGLFFLLQGDMYGPSLHPVVSISIPRRYYA